jgi:hypothetical protein
MQNKIQPIGQLDEEIKEMRRLILKSTQEKTNRRENMKIGEPAEVLNNELDFLCRLILLFSSTL